MLYRLLTRVFDVEVELLRPTAALPLRLAEGVARFVDRLQRGLKLRVQLARVHEAATEVVDDRHMLDPDRTDLDAGHALHARPHGLRPDGVAEQVRVRREQRLDAQRGADTEGSLGLLSQIEDEVARREGVARCGGRTSLVTLAALRAGVELEQMRRREIGDDAVPHLLRCRAGRQLNEALSCHVVPRRDAGRAASACAPPS